jgi:hypothetical protein
MKPYDNRRDYALGLCPGLGELWRLPEAFLTVPWSLAFRAAWTLLGVETWAVSGWPRFPAVFVFFTSFDIHVFPSRAIVSGLNRGS